MNWLNKLERKFGRYAVPNLIVYLIGAYSVGYVLNMVAPNILGFLNFQPYYILHCHLLFPDLALSFLPHSDLPILSRAYY